MCDVPNSFGKLQPNVLARSRKEFLADCGKLWCDMSSYLHCVNSRQYGSDMTYGVVDHAIVRSSECRHIVRYGLRTDPRLLELIETNKGAGRTQKQKFAYDWNELSVTSDTVNALIELQGNLKRDTRMKDPTWKPWSREPK